MFIHRPHTNKDRDCIRDQILPAVHALRKALNDAGLRVDLLILAGDFNFNQHDPERDLAKIELDVSGQWHTFPETHVTTAKNEKTGNEASIDRIAYQVFGKWEVIVIGTLVARNYRPPGAFIHQHYPMMIRLRVACIT